MTVALLQESTAIAILDLALSREENSLYVMKQSSFKLINTYVEALSFLQVSSLGIKGWRNG